MHRLNFASALYLGMLHPSRQLQPWSQLTQGMPAALAPPPGASASAQRLAALIGCEQATLAPSTLHLFWDLFGVLAARPLTIFLDAGAYPVARWGAERAAARGARVHTFPHHDTTALRRLLDREVSRARLPVVLADGYCPVCGRPAPLADYLAQVRAVGGLLVLDDTQAFGILGRGPCAEAPYGSGGGGSLGWSGAGGANTLVIASLAKGFGVPLAVLTGSAAMVGRFKALSETRVHCSPPPMTSLRAIEQALVVNNAYGDVLRARLIQQVKYFRMQLAQAGLRADGGLFPVQTIANITGGQARRMHLRLSALGILSVLHRGHDRQGPRLSLIITALHHPEQIDHMIDGLAQAMEVYPNQLGRRR